MKAFFLSLLIAASSAVSVAQTSAQLPVLDSDFACVTEAKAAQYTRDFNINVGSFGGKELCKNNVDTKKLFNDLNLLEDGKFGNIPANNLIKGFVPADQYYTWMKGETRGGRRGQDMPTATAYNSGGYFTMQDGWSALSTLGRVGTVVHEARHTAGYRHLGCQQGPYYQVSVAGCDRDYTYGGSHAVEMEYYARVSTAGVNFHPVYKKMARLMAMGRSNFVFNASPLKQTESLMMIGSSGRAYLLHDGAWVEREAPSVKARLKRTSFGATLFGDGKAYALDSYQNSGFDWSVVDDYSYYKLLNSENMGGAKVQDFEEFDMGRKRYVMFMNETQQYTNFNFGQGRWNSMVRAPNAGRFEFATVTPTGDQGLFMVDENRNFYAVDPERIQNVRALNIAWPQDAKSFAKVGTALYQVTQHGELLVSANGAWSPFTTPEPVEQLTSVPLYDSFEVQH